MAAHVDVDGDCPLAVVPCQYTDVGCKFKVWESNMLQNVIKQLFLIREQHVTECY